MANTDIAHHAPLVEVMRGSRAEGVHYGAMVVCDDTGAVVASIGSAEHVTYPRSSLKAFQALPLVETGAADALRLEPRHLALACASHRAEPFQVNLVTSWLQSLNLAEEAYACGPAWPRAVADRDAAVAAGQTASRIFHNCSGKHTGMLSVCVHAGFPTQGYADIDHPLQQRIIQTVGELAGRSITKDDLGTDGCDLPAIALSMREMATAVARFAACKGANDVQSTAMQRLLDAMRRHPDHVSGRGQATQVLCQTTDGRILMKTGAEGYLVAWLPEDKLGIAIKTADGSDRARVPVLIELLDQLGLLSRRESEAMESLRRPSITNSAGREVGSLCPCFRCRTPATDSIGRFRAEAVA